ncbi:MAG: hypothetical protein HFI29_14950 [Lachnospiraceae bacterium]|nr:hypothetical protein [Lachnospiraceae bacterium]
MIGLLILAVVFSFFFGLFTGLKYSHKEMIRIRELAFKHLELLKITVKWLKNDHKITDYMEGNGYETAAIYGMSYLGECLEAALRKSGKDVLYGIDRNADRLFNAQIPIYTINDELPDVDVMIVTTLLYYEQIKSEIERKMSGKPCIVSLEEILYQ